MPEQFFSIKSETKDKVKQNYEDIATSEFFDPDDPFNKVDQVVERIITMPYRMLKGVAEEAHKARTGARNLQAGPMGEGGEWLQSQVETAQAATMTAMSGLVGSTPGGGVGELELSIARKDLFKSFGKGIRDLNQKFQLVPEEKVAYKNLITAAKKMPQEALDPIKTATLHDQLMIKTRLSPDKEVSLYGLHNRKEDSIKFAIEALGRGSLEDPKRAMNTFIHEVGHNMQKQFGHLGDDMGIDLIESHMEYFGHEVTGRMAKRGSIDYDELVAVYNSSLNKARVDLNQGKTLANIRYSLEQQRQLERVTNELGGEIFGSAEKRDLLSEAMSLEKGFSKKAFDLGRDVHAGKVSREAIESAHKELKGLKMDPMEKATRGQYFSEAAEFADILGGKTKGLEGKVNLLKKLGELPESFGKTLKLHEGEASQFRIKEAKFPDVLGVSGKVKEGYIEGFFPKTKEWKGVSGVAIPKGSETAWQAAEKRLAEFTGRLERNVIKLPVKEPEAIGRLRDILKSKPKVTPEIHRQIPVKGMTSPFTDEPLSHLRIGSYPKGYSQTQNYSQPYTSISKKTKIVDDKIVPPSTMTHHKEQITNVLEPYWIEGKNKAGSWEEISRYNDLKKAEEGLDNFIKSLFTK